MKPTDRRIHSKPARLVKMKLELDLIDAIEVMAADLHRDFHNVIDIALRWAAWSHSRGRSPEREMMEQPGGFAKWDEKIRAKREMRELKRLYELGDEKHK
jgi:hypothetical protein